MTNPNNAVGTNAAYDGRTSVNAFNDDLTIYSRGILSGWGCSPKSGMTVTVGGNGTDRDAAVAEDNAGNKTSINNISGSPIDVTIPAAPATNSRIDLIVAYADNPPTGVSTVADNPAACGIIVVSGTAAANPTQPTNATIRSAITTDGATGATAYYVILAKIRVGQGVTTIGSGVITQGDVVTSYATPATDTVVTDSIADGAITSDKIDYATLPQLVYVGKAGRQTSAAVSNNIYGMTALETPFYAATGCSAALNSGRVTFTLPAGGTYFIEAHFESWINANTWDYMLFSIRKNATAFTAKMAYKGGAWGFVTNSGISTIENGDIIDVYVNTNGNNFADGNISTQNTFILFKIWRIG